jgi:hypothetical protein
VPKALVPLLSTSLNVGMALGAYITTIPFQNPAYPGPAIATWFEGFFKPGFIGITTLGALTLGSGLRAFWFHRGAQKQARSATVSRWALAGLVFTLTHFGFGNTASRLLRVQEVVDKADTRASRCSRLWTRFWPSRNSHSPQWRSG